MKVLKRREELLSKTIADRLRHFHSTQNGVRANTGAFVFLYAGVRRKTRIQNVSLQCEIHVKHWTVDYISCTARRSNDVDPSTEGNIVKEMHTRLQDSCDDLESCPDLSTLTAIRFIHEKCRNNEHVLEGYLLVPDSTFHFSPIRMKNVCDIPLAKYLKERMKMKDCTQPQVLEIVNDSAIKL